MSRAEAQGLVHDLAQLVEEGYTLLTWNGLGFDFNILAEESGLQTECERLAMAYGAKQRPRLGRCWSSLPSSLRLCRLRCSSSSSRSLAG